MDTSPDAETNAITFGLLLATIVGAAIILATLINTARKRRKRDARSQELFNLQTGLHPADDIYGRESPDDWDDWPELEEWMKRHPYEGLIAQAQEVIHIAKKGD